MRILSLLIISCLFFMCKTKDVVPTQQLTQFVVILQDDFTPKAIQKDIPFEMVDFKKINKTLNQWRVNFNIEEKDQTSLKRALLNHPKVINVFTPEQMEIINLKNSKKAKVGSLGEKQATKQ